MGSSRLRLSTPTAAHAQHRKLKTSGNARSKNRENVTPGYVACDARNNPISSVHCVFNVRPDPCIGNRSSSSCRQPFALTTLGVGLTLFDFVNNANLFTFERSCEIFWLQRLETYRSNDTTKWLELRWKQTSADRSTYAAKGTSHAILYTVYDPQRTSPENGCCSLISIMYFDHLYSGYAPKRYRYERDERMRYSE